MDIEYEATFININKDEIRQRLQSVGATLLRPEFLQKRINFKLPLGHEQKGAWLRVRDEGDKISLSLKVVDGERIEDQKETQLIIDNFENGRALLISIGCVEKAYQETRRELWVLDGVEVTIDEWPFLPPYVEVEGDSEASVRSVSEKLGFEWSQARFCAVDALYSEVYGLSFDRINNMTPRIVFDMENPFLDK
jgi:adenylate cyclase class 2